MFRLSACKQAIFLSDKSVSKANFLLDAGGLLGKVTPFPQFDRAHARFLSASSGRKGSFGLCLSVPLSPVHRAELRH